MSEITKLYKNAGIELQYLYTVEYMGNDGVSKLTGCNKETILNLFPEYNKRNYKVTKANKTDNFTADKQIELIKKLGNINIDIDNGCYMSSEILKVKAHCDTFEETLAEVINNLWQDLTEQEMVKIKRILE